MTAKTKDAIKAFFETGDQPTEAQFVDFIDSYVDKSGPVGDIETDASAGTAGIATFTGGSGQILTYANVRDNQMGIQVYTSAQSDNVARAAIADSIPTTAAATAGTDTSAVMTPFLVAKAVPGHVAYATTAQAAAGTDTGVAMDPVLTKAAIAALESGSTAGWTKLETINVSTTVASVDFTSAIDSTYHVYAIPYSGLVPQTDGDFIDFRVSQNAADFDAGSDYDYGIIELAAGGTLTQTGGTGNAQIRLVRNAATGVGKNSGEGAGGIIYIYAPSSTTLHTHVMHQSGSKANNGTQYTNFGSGVRTTTAAINGFQIIGAGGGIQAGTFVLYGLGG